MKEWIYMSERILANAVVDLLEDGPDPIWEVTVYSPDTEQDGQRRVYTITGKDDNFAAQEGIRRFVEEMENLRDALTKDD